MTNKIPFKFRTKDTEATHLGGPLPPPNPYPQIHELSTLERDDPRWIVDNAQGFLSQMYSITRVSSLPILRDNGEKYPSIFFLGNPYRKQEDVVVSQVWNRWIDGWGRLPQKPPRTFDDKSITKQFYGNDAWGRQFWIQGEAEAEITFNASTAYKSEYGIFINTHQTNLRNALYHELLHTFETNSNLFSNSRFFVEGFVEYFSRSFVAWHDKKKTSEKLKAFKPYSKCDEEIGKLVRQTSEKICARAFFDDSEADLTKLLPMFDKRIRKWIKPENQLSEEALKAAFDPASGVGKIRDGVALENKSKRTSPAWYRQWRDWPEYKDVARKVPQLLEEEQS